MNAKLRVGVRPPLATFERGGEALATFVERAEAAGLDHLCVGDHVSFRDGYGYDGLVQATALAVTSRLPVHTSVYLLPLRHPVAVARQVSSLAQLAPGRLVFGVGMGGDDPHELEVCGIELTVRGLDAIDASPVLDIKPYMTEFAPRAPVRQPRWSRELMSGYWQ